MKIIDAHTHVQAIPGHMWDSPPERILKLMDQAGIEQGVIMPYSEITPDNLQLLDETLQAIEKYPDRLFAFARMHPGGEEKGLEIFSQLVQSGKVRGLKFHPVGTRVHPADERSVAYVEKAAEFGVPILFHCGDEEWTLPFQIGKLAAKVPDAKIILGHMGGYFHVHQAIAVAKRYPNCYLETSATPDPRLIRLAIDEVGVDRILFGSDGPGCLPSLEVAKIKLLELSLPDQRKIFSENFASLLARE